MAKVTDIQDMNGVSKEIQDKDLANRTSQSSIASSDFVLLEDTNGAYHKISKASFTEAVRGALGSVINSVAKGTDIAKLPVLDSNNDLGMGTLANVASVLGAGKIIMEQGVSPDTLLNSGTYFFINAQADLPDSTSQWIIVVFNVMSELMSFGVQLAFAVDNQTVYYRMIWANRIYGTWIALN